MSISIALLVFSNIGFKTPAARPKLLPELDSFFRLLNYVAIQDQHKEALLHLTVYVLNGNAMVSTDLLSYFERAGYKLSLSNKGEIKLKYNERLAPVLITDDRATIAKLPAPPFFPLSLCDSSESGCKLPVNTETGYYLDHPNPKLAFSQDKLEQEFKQIATEISYAMKMTQPTAN